MRADRLVSLVLLLRQRGRLSADTLARELEVSTRTVLRDIEALSAAGVPVYAERGRHGGFALLPGFRTELTGLNHDEALALLAAGSARGEQVFGLGTALASAMRKVVDALPEGHRATASDAAQRILVDPETDLLSRRRVADEVPDTTMIEVRRAVLAGHKLRIHYAAVDRPAKWRTVDPIGLVTVRDKGYLLATTSGADRTYRLSRILAAEELAEPALRPDRVDLDQVWQERSMRFRTGGDQVTVLVRVDPARREELVGTALAVLAEETDGDGFLRLEVTFQDSRHAEWALWQLSTDAEALAPQSLRTSLRDRAAAIATRYGGTRARVAAMVLDPNRRLQSLYVPVGDGVRLAVDVWLPVERIAAGETVGAVVRTTRYYRAKERAGVGPEHDANRAEGELWNAAGFAFVVADARGTGASFGVRTSELGEREIADYGELIDRVAAWPWSNGRVGAYGTSYEGQAAELVARLQNPHLVAVAALFSPNDPYRQLFYPGGVATSGRYARWMWESQLKDGVIGARERLAELRGLPVAAIRLPTPVKPVDGPDGPALLAEAVAEHQANVAVHELMDQVPFRDDRVDGLDWPITTPAAAYEAIAATNVPLLTRVGWVDGAFVSGALTRFATLPNQQTVEIGPWGHGGRTHADPLRPADPLDDSDLGGPEGQDRRLVEFFARYLTGDSAPPEGSGTLTYSTLGTDQWRTVDTWPPENLEVRRLYPVTAGALVDDGEPAGNGALVDDAESESTVRYVVDPGSSSGPTNRWLAGEIGQGAAYPDRQGADETLLTFTSAPLSADLHLLGFPVVTLQLATNGTDGVVYVYLEDVGPDGSVTYLTEGCLRFLQRATAGPAEPTGLGVPRSFARADRLPVEPGENLDLVVELLPLSAVLRSGHRIRIAIAGNDASCFSYYGSPGETFTLTLGESTYLDLPVQHRQQ